MSPTDLLTLAVTLAVFTMKFALGFNTELRFLRYFHDRTGLLLRSLIAVVVLVPLIAFVLVEVFDLPYGVAAALLLLSASPGAPLAPFKAYRAFGIYAYAISLQFWVTLLAVFTLPAWLAVFQYLYGLEMSALPADVARQLAFAVLLPLGAGVMARRWFPAWSERYGRTMVRVANSLMLLFGLALLVVLFRLLVQTDGLSWLAFALFLLSALLVGHFLGGPEPKGRTTLAMMTATRNLGIALFVALQNAEESRVLAMAIPYLVVMLVVTLGYGAWRRQLAQQKTAIR